MGLTARGEHKMAYFRGNISLLVALGLLLASCNGLPAISTLEPIQVTKVISDEPEPSSTPIVCQESDAGHRIAITFITDTRVRVDVEGLPPHTDVRLVYTSSVKDAAGGRTVRSESIDKSDGTGRCTDENDFGGYEHNGVRLDRWQVAVVYEDKVICSEFTLP